MSTLAVNLLAALWGASFVLLVLYALYLRGARDILEKQIKVLAAENYAQEANFKALAGKVQQLQQPLQVNYSDEQLTGFADRVLNKVRMIVEAEQNAALNKLD